MSLSCTPDGSAPVVGMSEYDIHCGTGFVEPASFAGCADFVQIPQGKCAGAGDTAETIDR